MIKPTDYPMDTPRANPPGEQPDGDYTLAMLRERLAARQTVTDEMIRVARAKMDSAHSATTHTDFAKKGKLKLSKLRKRIR